MTTDGELNLRGMTKIAEAIRSLGDRPKPPAFPNYPNDVIPTAHPDLGPSTGLFDKVAPTPVPSGVDPSWYHETTWVVRFYNEDALPEVDEYQTLPQAIAAAKGALEDDCTQVRVFERTMYVTPEKEYTAWKE